MKNLCRGHINPRSRKSYSGRHISIYCSIWQCGRTADSGRIYFAETLSCHCTGRNIEENRFLLLLREVIKKQAELIAKWQLVGFIHGVMNTDNMAISGETIDYGPCAFMDTYSPETVFSSIDTHGRYAYGNQPGIAAWNLARFAETLLPLLHDDGEKSVNMANEEVSEFAKLYSQFWLNGMRAKLGLYYEEAGDESLIKELLTIMEKYKADYTNTFKNLTLVAAGGVSVAEGSVVGKPDRVGDRPDGMSGKPDGVDDRSNVMSDRPEGMNFFCTHEFIGWKEKWEKEWREKINRKKNSSS